MSIKLFSKWRPSVHLEFSKFRVDVTCDLYRHAILLSCIKFNSAAEVWLKIFFKIVAVRVRHLKFKKNLVA